VVVIEVDDAREMILHQALDMGLPVGFGAGFADVILTRRALRPQRKAGTPDIRTTELWRNLFASRVGLDGIGRMGHAETRSARRKAGVLRFFRIGMRFLA
jgi:hypothetical protein